MMNLTTIISIITIPLLFIDAYKSDATLYSYVHIDSRILALISIVIICYIRTFHKQILHTVFTKINFYVLFPTSLLLSVSLTVFDYLTPPNYVFSLFSIQYSQVFLISIYLGLLVLLQQPDEWYKKYYHQIIFLSTPVILFSAFITSLFPFDVFIKLSHEDNLIENTQVVALVLGAYWSYRFSQTLLKNNIKLHAVIFLLVAIGLLFVAGDEISWGQRIFHFQTPQEIMIRNDQKEFTVHNMSFFHFVNTGYIVIGFYGAFLWLTQLIFRKLNKVPFSLYISPWFCSGYYFLGFLYNYYTKITINHTVGIWSEFAELMLYSGIMFTVFNLYLNRDKIIADFHV